MTDDNDEYKAKIARAKTLASRLLKENEINPKTKQAYKLIYAVFYGVFDGNLPAGVQILLIAGRATELLENKE